MKLALKEARLQKFELTNRNEIRGINTWVSNHIIAKPNEHQKSIYVDFAGLDGRNRLLPGEVLDKLRASYTKNSAEVIVVGETSHVETWRTQ